MGYGPRELDESTPNAARLYDYFLGGAHNFAADRALGEMIVTHAPVVREGARMNRSFLRRAVRYYLEQGIDQFLDLGSGIPTVGNVHEIVHRVDPGARVVYVDYEPIAVQTARHLLADVDTAAGLHADLRDVKAVLGHPTTTAMLDLTRPVGLLIVGVTLFLAPEDHPERIIASYRDALAPGSLVAISQSSVDEAPDDLRAEMDQIMAGYQNSDERWYVRGRAEFTSWFDGTDVVAPGIVPLTDWRPDDEARAQQQWQARMCGYAAVGRLPG
jgi:SAM-dependent methyltransferase